jgi:hypothetical protein
MNIQKSVLEQTLFEPIPKGITDFTASTAYNVDTFKISKFSRNTNDINRLVLHCDDATNWTPERLSSFFVYERKFPICAYHYYVCADAIYQMVHENILTYHAAPFNSKSIGVAINFNADRDEKLNAPLNPQILQNAVLLFAYLSVKFAIRPIEGNIFGHRELPGTGWFKGADNKIHLRKTCPGLTINLNTFRFEVAREVQKICNNWLDITKQDSVQRLSLDGLFGQKSTALFTELVRHNVFA